MDEDDGFFGFDTNLPRVRHGPKQELGDVELEQEDTYDAFNDETFGCALADEDWEEEHEKLADFENEVIETRSPKETEAYSIQEGEFTYLPQTPGKILKKEGFGNVEFGRDDEDAANVATTMSQILLEDDDIESILSRPINYSQSMDSKLFGRISPQSSIFDSDVGSPSRPSIWSAQPSDVCRSMDTGPKRLQSASSANGSLSGSSAVAMNHLIPQKSLFKTVEELERDLLRQPNPTALTMEELERKILSQSPLSSGSPHVMAEMKTGFTGDQRAPPMCMIPSPNPHMRSPLVRLPPTIGMALPPPPISARPLVPVRMPMTLAGLRLGGPLILPPQQVQRWTPGIPFGGCQPTAVDQPRVNDPPSRAVPALVNEGNDDYAGLMSTKEKQWLMSIQINQLISDNPYVDDYYFSVLRLRCLGKLQQGEEQNKEGGPRFIIPERAKAETKTYAPTQFANSLGKLQVVTYTAPRRIIDAGISQTLPELSQDPLLAAKETKKFKQVLLDIEKMYAWLLELEDAEMRCESLRQDTDSSYPQAVADYQLKLQSFLATGDRLQQIMFVRKGKVLILRAWSRLTRQYQELIVRNVLVHCIALIRRDTHDHVLVRFLPLVNDVFASMKDLNSLVGMAQLIDTSQKNSGFVSVTGTKMGLDLISLMLYRGTELWPDCCDDIARTRWADFVSSVGVAVLATPVPLQSDLGLLSTEPFEQVGIDEGKLSAIKDILKTIGGRTG